MNETAAFICGLILGFLPGWVCGFNYVHKRALKKSDLEPIHRALDSFKEKP